MSWRVASDIGGTFTDIAHIDARGLLTTAKTPSTPPNFGHGVVAGISNLAERLGLKMADLEEMAHGCTIATNAILEAKGARTALLTTKGFRDVLELRRIRVPRLYEPLYVKPKPLAPRNLRFEASERVSADGHVLTPLDVTSVEEAAKSILSSGAEAVAVCFLHSYLYPDHERQAGEILRSMLPDAFVTLSVDVLPEIREYERTSTTVVNAYIGPAVRHYLEGMEADLNKADCPARISIMQSSGGAVDAEAVKEKPAQIVECGPAAGVVGAAHLSGLLGIKNVITFDMGGTTAKGSMIENGSVIFAEDYEIGSSMSTAGAIAGGGGYALKLPAIDISEVGAGGGSIVRIDRAGAIKVGPDSAGAVPGPACYKIGGTEPTVTDANVVLGYLSQTSLAGGTVPIDPKLSYQSMERIVGPSTGMDVHKAAYGVYQIANANMVRAIKAVTTYRGRDPRDFVMFAFGGNGGVHGVGIAKSLEIKRVIVPPAAGVFSAVGLLLAKRSVTVGAALPGHLDTLPIERVNQKYDQLKARSEQLLALKTGSADFVLQVEMRYVGQAFELTIDLGSASFKEASRTDLRSRFDAEHENRFGHSFGEHEAVEIVSLKLQAVDPNRDIPEKIAIACSRSEREVFRDVWFGNAYGHVRTLVISRGDLGKEPRNGPLVVEEYEGTTVVPPDATAFKDRLDNIVIDLEYRV